MLRTDCAPARERCRGRGLSGARCGKRTIKRAAIFRAPGSRMTGADRPAAGSSSEPASELPAAGSSGEDSGDLAAQASVARAVRRPAPIRRVPKPRMRGLFDSPHRNLIFGVAYTISVMILGTAAYLAAGWSLRDAFYMVVTTVYT